MAIHAEFEFNVNRRHPVTLNVLAQLGDCHRRGITSAAIRGCYATMHVEIPSKKDIQQKALDLALESMTPRERPNSRGLVERYPGETDPAVDGTGEGCLNIFAALCLIPIGFLGAAVASWIFEDDVSMWSFEALLVGIVVCVVVAIPASYIRSIQLRDRYAVVLFERLERLAKKLNAESNDRLHGLPADVKTSLLLDYAAHYDDLSYFDDYTKIYRRVGEKNDQRAMKP